jgi:hypothetical protein
MPESYTDNCLAKLPFVKLGTNGKMVFWPKTPVSNWSRDCEIGRARAVWLLEYMRNGDDSNIMSKIAQSISEADCFTGIETGFFTKIGEGLIKRQV